MHANVSSLEYYYLYSLLYYFCAPYSNSSCPRLIVHLSYNALFHNTCCFPIAPDSIYLLQTRFTTLDCGRGPRGIVLKPIAVLSDGFERRLQQYIRRTRYNICPVWFSKGTDVGYIQPYSTTEVQRISMSVYFVLLPHRTHSFPRCAYIVRKHK